jgi:hypothetical protein
VILADIHGSLVGFAESIEARGIQELFVFSIPGVSPFPLSLSPLFVADVIVEIEAADFTPAEPPGLDCSLYLIGHAAF